MRDVDENASRLVQETYVAAQSQPVKVDHVAVNTLHYMSTLPSAKTTVIDVSNSGKVFSVTHDSAGKPFLEVFSYSLRLVPYDYWLIMALFLYLFPYRSTHLSSISK